MRANRSRTRDRGRLRVRELARRFGQELRVARMSAGLTQAQVAGRVGVSQQAVSLAERGSLSVSIEARCLLAAACGHELAWRLYPISSVSLRDSGQLELARTLLAGVHRSTRARMEVPVRAGDLRAADLVLETAAELIHVEIERSPFDLQAQLRAAQIKRSIIAHGTGKPVRLVIALPSTRSNRERMRHVADVVQRAFPISSRRVATCLATGEQIGGDGILWLART